MGTLWARLLNFLSDAPSLTLRAAPGLGMHVHVSRKKDASRMKGDAEFIVLTESGSTCTFFHRVPTLDVTSQLNHSNQIALGLGSTCSTD